MKNKLIVVIVLVVAAAVCLPLLAEEEAEVAKYVGDKKCKPCHSKIYNVWKETPHADAWQSMVDSAGVDTSCVACHATGYGEPDGFIDTLSTPNLTNVQCEMCHGPGSIYKKLPIMKDREKALASGMVIPNESVCISCHTAEQSPDFNYEEALKAGSHYVEAEEK